MLGPCQPATSEDWIAVLKLSQSALSHLCTVYIWNSSVIPADLSRAAEALTTELITIIPVALDWDCGTLNGSPLTSRNKFNLRPLLGGRMFGLRRGRYDYGGHCCQMWVTALGTIQSRIVMQCQVWRKKGEQRRSIICFLRSVRKQTGDLRKRGIVTSHRIGVQRNASLTNPIHPYTIACDLARCSVSSSSGLTFKGSAIFFNPAGQEPAAP